MLRASIRYFTGKKWSRNERVMGKTVEIGPTLNQILLSDVDKTAYLGGSICAQILSAPQRLGPQAETLKQGCYFSYNTQLPDRQELIRSSRNLGQKMTPWHKEHSNGLCSQDHILRTQVRLCARPTLLENSFSPDGVALAHRVFLTHNELIHKPGYVGKRTCSDTTWNSRIVKIFPGLAGISIGKTVSDGPKTLRWPLFAEPYLANPSSVSRKSKTLRERVAQAFQRYQELQNPTSGDRSNTCVNTDKKQEKRAEDQTRFSSRTTAFARRVFPARCKLIRKPGCIGNMATPATTCNSRFAGGFPRLAEIFTRKMQKNSSGTPTSGSHNVFFQTPIRTKFISLESRRRELSNDMLHDPF
uniref:Uncharacterized protein n=1 Tax=Fagus sylvatica TaxID=28930 RepID=A0A2N9G5Q7_FAGSY